MNTHLVVCCLSTVYSYIFYWTPAYQITKIVLILYTNMDDSLFTIILQWVICHSKQWNLKILNYLAYWFWCRVLSTNISLLWMNEPMNEWTNEWINQWMNDGNNEWINEWIYEHIMDLVWTYRTTHTWRIIY